MWRAFLRSRQHPHVADNLLLRQNNPQLFSIYRSSAHGHPILR
nr:MAG TPA_asm: hypothetical protein [Caudoviricetes sp.]